MLYNWTKQIDEEVIQKLNNKKGVTQKGIDKIQHNNKYTCKYWKEGT